MKISVSPMPGRHAGVPWVVASMTALVGAFIASNASAGDARSHPPLRRHELTLDRPMDKGPAYFVDPQRGDDAGDGSRERPFRTIAAALPHLRPGDTLYLHGGVYYENVYIAMVGQADAPITIRACPGEHAILDGGLRFFAQSPSAAWEPFTDGGASDEYRSTQAYPNLRDVVGSFGDSFVKLQTYWHASDLRADNELWDQPAGQDVKPIYVGPGIWYNRDTHRIHARLAHTHLEPVTNYTGQTDPRNLPLIIAPFDSVPLRLSGAAHVRLQDLTIRGGGYDTVIVQQSSNIEFDNVVIHCGTYGMRTRNVVGLRFHRSALYGGIPPWCFRNENGLRNRKGAGMRDIARLTGHALWVSETGREFSVYAMPLNDDWEISYSQFTDGHDGLYLGGVNVRFHHNLVDNMHDDGIYLSPMYPYSDGQSELYQNLFSRCLTALAFGGLDATGARTLIYRNVFDLRGPVNYLRPSPDKPGGVTNISRIMGDHGSPPWPSMHIYHNTAVFGGPMRQPHGGAFEAPDPSRPRFVLNNLFLHLSDIPAYQPADPERGIIVNGNLFWSAGNGSSLGGGYFDRFRQSPTYAMSKSIYAPGATAHSVFAEPVFERFAPDWTQPNDYRPASNSPAVDAGAPIPSDWPDPLRQVDADQPDIGALPLNGPPLHVGRHAAP